jgi:uncharacterized protein YuzE
MTTHATPAAPALRTTLASGKVPDPELDSAFRYAAHGSVTLRYAPGEDALTILYGQGAVLHTAELDDGRFLDYSDDGRILSVEVLDASRGVDLDGVPRAADVAAALTELGLPANTPEASESA